MARQGLGNSSPSGSPGGTACARVKTSSSNSQSQDFTVFSRKGFCGYVKRATFSDCNPLTASSTASDFGVMSASCACCAVAPPPSSAFYIAAVRCARTFRTPPPSGSVGSAVHTTARRYRDPAMRSKSAGLSSAARGIEESFGPPQKNGWRREFSFDRNYLEVIVTLRPGAQLLNSSV